MTIFAPTNDAFAALDPALLSKYLEPAWITHLQNLFVQSLAPLPACKFYATVDGAQVSSSLSGYMVGLIPDPWIFTGNTAGIFVSGLVFNMSQVIEADFVAVDGVVHKVEKAFFAASLSTNLYDLMFAIGYFSTFISLLDSTGLASVVRFETMTLLAPFEG
jgi:hypothetical protein